MLTKYFNLNCMAQKAKDANNLPLFVTKKGDVIDPHQYFYHDIPEHFV